MWRFILYCSFSKKKKPILEDIQIVKKRGHIFSRPKGNHLVWNYPPSSGNWERFCPRQVSCCLWRTSYLHRHCLCPFFSGSSKRSMVLSRNHTSALHLNDRGEERIWLWVVGNEGEDLGGLECVERRRTMENKRIRKACDKWRKRVKKNWELPINKERGGYDWFCLFIFKGLRLNFYFGSFALFCAVQGPGCLWGHSSVTGAGGPQIRGSAV